MPILSWRQAIRASLHAEFGDVDAARRALADCEDALGEAGAALPENVRRVARIISAPAVSLVGVDDFVARWYVALLECPFVGAGSFGGSWSIARLRGAVALRLDRVDEADEHFRRGLEFSERSDVRFDIEAGRNLQGLAEVANRRGEREQAMEYLDRAGELFSRHGAKLYLDQVLAKKELLKA